MAGDTLRDAFRSELAAVADQYDVDWPIADLVNTTENPDAGEGFIALEFPGGSEDQFTTGSPGSNLFQEIGQVTIRVYAPRGLDRNTAETYAASLRTGFRARRFTCGDRTIRITSTAPMGDGVDEAGMWAESLALGYEIFNVG